MMRNNLTESAPEWEPGGQTTGWLLSQALASAA